MIQLNGTAIVLADDFITGDSCKTTHGLIRKSLKFDIVGIVDEKNAEQYPSAILNGIDYEIPVVSSIQEILEKLDASPKYCIVGMATVGGIITPFLIKHSKEALKQGISLISGLHSFVGENKELVEAAKEGGAELIDIRKSKPRNELHFWTGDILSVKAPRIAMLGKDCNLGKRTSAQFLVDKCLGQNIKAEMIYTGQSGWLQGGKYGFILDSTVNDFVSGEIEHAIVECDKHESPDIILLEGQSALRNPSGPCGSELIISGKAEGVILNYGPGYKCFQGFEEIDWELGSIKDEIELIRLYGSNVMAIILNLVGVEAGKEDEIEQQLRKDLSIPVINIMRDGVDELIPIVKNFIEKYKKP
ncbi:MAG: DUF1611 domain-containing protein [Flavobacteriales bacterium]|nr:DUF1611 domain-containing protein [Flavobacteriales bacterium]